MANPIVMLVFNVVIGYAMFTNQSVASNGVTALDSVG